ncbi:DNA-binding protein [Streptomyces lydicus]
MTDKSIYRQPARPEDPDAEYLTVQETAWIMRCSVNTIRRRLLALKRGGTLGRRILVSRADRQALYAAAVSNRRQQVLKRPPEATPVHP